MGAEHTDSVLGVECFRWNPLRAVAGEPGRAAPVANFGDLLGPHVVRAVVDRAVERPRPKVGARLMSVGSIMHFVRSGDVIWGAGINGKVDLPDVPADLDIRAVRGPYTRGVLRAKGVDAPDIVGDPAVLIPALWPETIAWTRQKRYEVLVVPNLNEAARFDGQALSPTGDPWRVIHAIAQSEFVCATSLHALIVADALGIPSRPLSSLVEHPFKYVDYYASTGRTGVRFARSVKEAVKWGPIPLGNPDVQGLLDAFPFDLWGGERSVRRPYQGRVMRYPSSPAEAETAEEAETLARFTQILEAGGHGARGSE